MLVTISGLPGSGTSTVARAVAERLGIPRVDGGTVWRSIAAELGLSVAAFSALCETDPEYDRELDRRLAARATEGDVVLESRLAGWIATNEKIDGLRVWIECSDEERARRVSDRDGGSVEQSLTENRVRATSEATRYRTYYGIDIGDLSIYDLILDSTSAPPEDLVEAIASQAARS